jgi:protein farnesyltransferase/geranylgeranyltransferase type-1 subunit alpha
LIDHLNDPTNEREFMARMFEQDAKNYHVWSYRVWLVKRFNLWDSELPYLDDLISEDVRNNSAWSHRYFVIFQRPERSEESVSGSGDLAFTDADVDNEIQYIQEKLDLAPQNPSPWNYLRGILKASKRPITSARPLCERYASLAEPEAVVSSHALDILASVYAAEDDKESARRCFRLLSERYDPIRKGYWVWREGLLERRMLSREGTTITLQRQVRSDPAKGIAGEDDDGSETIRASAGAEISTIEKLKGLKIAAGESSSQ